MCQEGRFYKAHCLNITTALYDFVTYCELFHHDIRSKIDRDASVSAMGPATRELWIENCLRDVDYKGFRRSVLRNRRLRDLVNLSQCHSLPEHASHIVLRATTPTSWNYSKSWLFGNFMQHQGLATLKILLDDGFSSIEERDRTIGDYESLTSPTENEGRAIYRFSFHPNVKWDSLHGDWYPLSRRYL